MKTKSVSLSGLFNPRCLLPVLLCLVCVFLAALGFAANPTPPGWSLITASNNSDGLTSVACAAVNDCWAVGPGNVIAHWNGTSWAIVASPNVADAVPNSVACASASECWIAGYYSNGGVAQTLIERWDGNSWTVVPSPNTSPSNGNYLYGVACASASECLAVGYHKPGILNQTLIERWDGNSWTIVTSPNYPNFPASNVLNGVTCAAASDCWAVGGWDDGESSDTLIEHWNGMSWSITAAPVTGLALKSVACASTSECLAVSNSNLQSGQPLIELWNGTTWAIVPSAIPSPSPDTDHGLFSVTCGSASKCWAVGYYNNGVSPRTLIEQWDGSTWSIASSPNNGTLANYLSGVTCASASQCWAVGYYVNGNGRQTLIEEFAPTIPPLAAVVSRKIHGNAGTFDVDLLNPPAIECRSPGATGTAGVDYRIVFSFVNNVSNCGNASTGSLSSGPGPNQCTVNLSSVANQQYVTLALNNVLDSQNNTGNLGVIMGVLIGDVDGNGIVSNTDVAALKGQVAAPVTSSNFRNDVTANGIISNTDVSATKAQVGTSLP